MSERPTNDILLEWSFNPWVQDRFRTTGRFVVIIIIGVLGGALFYQNNPSLDFYVIPAILLLLALNLRYFLDSRYLITGQFIRVNNGKPIQLTHITCWKVGSKYLRLVVVKPQTRPELVSCDLPASTERLIEILTEKIGPMATDINQIKERLKKPTAKP